MSRRTIVFIVLILITALYPLLIPWRNQGMEPASTLEPQFEEGDLIPLLANKAFRSRDCRNFYYELPFCPPGDPILNRKKSLGEIVSSDCFTRTRYELKFKVETVGKILCEKTLTKDEVKLFKQAIRNKSKYQMNFNNILFPTRVGISTYPKPEYYYLVNHIDFYPQYYENQVVDIKCSCDWYSAVDITEDAEIRVNFTYSVFWDDARIKPTKSISQNGAAMKIKWWNSKEECGNNTFIKPSTFWVLNLCLALVVAGDFTVFAWRSQVQTSLVTYLKTKISHSVSGPGDVGCIIPAYRSFLGSILGIGIQHLIMISWAFSFDFPDSFYWLDLGSRTSILLVYNLLCSYFGYDSAFCYAKRLLKHNDGLSIQTYILTLLGVTFVYRYNDRMIITLVFTIVIVVAHLFPWYMGAIITYSLRYRPPRPTRRTKNNPKVAPITWFQSWLLSTPVQMFLGGLLPFLVIFREMDAVYASLLSLKVCGVFSTMLLFFVEVIIITILLGAGFTVFQLQKRDYIWWWRSVLRGGSTAIFMFVYGIFFYYRVNKEIFLMELYIFLVYNGCLSCVFFAVLGTTGFLASFLMAFLRRHG